MTCLAAGYDLLDETNASLDGRSLTTRKGLVERDNIDHSLGVGGGTEVLQELAIGRISGRGLRVARESQNHNEGFNCRCVLMMSDQHRVAEIKAIE